MKPQILSLLFVLGCAVLTGFAFVGYLLYMHGPTGRYLAANIMLEPSILQDLTFKDSSYGRGKEGTFVLDSIDFRYFDEKTHAWKKITLNQEQYAKIYSLLKEDVSLATVEDEVVANYAKGNPTLLEIKVKPLLSDHSPHSSHVLQTVNLLVDSYRVKLRAFDGTNDYAYFLHPQANVKVLSIVQ